jgi:hypothetical protein
MFKEMSTMSPMRKKMMYKNMRMPSKRNMLSNVNRDEGDLMSPKRRRTTNYTE